MLLLKIQKLEKFQKNEIMRRKNFRDFGFRFLKVDWSILSEGKTNEIY
jgi:hypothetical protein